LVCLSSFRTDAKWISALVMPQPGLAAAHAAWRGINSVDTIGAVAQARQRLAEIVLDLWREDPDQPLAARAIERFLDAPSH